MGAFEEFKSLEGARIQPLIGAVAALPAAALVLSRDGVEAGAPLFLSAIILIAGSYFMWLCSDSLFAISYDHDVAGNAEKANKYGRTGYYLSWATLIYGIASLFASAFGIAAIYSSISSPISVDQGFWAAFGVLGIVAVHCAHSAHLRNAADQN